MIQKIYFLFLLLCFGLFVGCKQQKLASPASILPDSEVLYELKSKSAFVDSARKQIGVVTKYDTGYYQGAYPPADRGACTDVIEQGLRANGYDLKKRIDTDMGQYPEKYNTESDPNINFRRVRNVKIYLDSFAESLSSCVTEECFQQNLWQAGDIVTFDQIPGSLWHIAFISDKKTPEGVPFLIHNYGRGVVEDNMLLSWPAPITGHYRIDS